MERKLTREQCRKAYQLANSMSLAFRDSFWMSKNRPTMSAKHEQDGFKLFLQLADTLGYEVEEKK